MLFELIDIYHKDISKSKKLIPLNLFVLLSRTKFFCILNIIATITMQCATYWLILHLLYIHKMYLYFCIYNIYLLILYSLGSDLQEMHLNKYGHIHT